jgi:hypothetical protein
MDHYDDKPKEIAIYQTVCENMPDPIVLCRLVDLISTRISMSPCLLIPMQLVYFLMISPLQHKYDYPPVD